MNHSISSAAVRTTGVASQFLPGTFSDVAAPVVRHAFRGVVLPQIRTVVATAAVGYVAVKVVPMLYRTYKWRNGAVRAQRRVVDNVTHLPDRSLANAA